MGNLGCIPPQQVDRHCQTLSVNERERAAAGADPHGRLGETYARPATLRAGAIPQDRQTAAREARERQPAMGGIPATPRGREKKSRCGKRKEENRQARAAQSFRGGQSEKAACPSGDACCPSPGTASCT